MSDLDTALNALNARSETWTLRRTKGGRYRIDARFEYAGRKNRRIITARGSTAQRAVDNVLAKADRPDEPPQPTHTLKLVGQFGEQ